MSALGAAIRLYRWMPPRTKRCPHPIGCSEMALAAVQAGQGVREVLRIVGTCATRPSATFLDKFECVGVNGP